MAALLYLPCWFACVAQEEAGLGLELIGLGLDIADMIISSQDHEEVMDKLNEITAELQEVLQKLDSIQSTLNRVLSEVEHLTIIIELQALNDAHVSVMTAFNQLKLQQGPDSNVAVLSQMAAKILELDSDVMKARQNYWEALMGTLPSQVLDGKTLPERALEQSHLLPVQLMQGLARTVAVNQAIISWAYMQTGQLAEREHDRSEWASKMQEAWVTNYKTVFAIGSCRWSTDHTVSLSCASGPVKSAKTTVNGTQTVTSTDCTQTGSGWISIPTKGTDHPEWSFDVSCGDAFATGIQGSSNVPSGHAVSYVAGFKLHCHGTGDSGDTGHWLHDSEDIDWNVQLDEPLTRVEGCVNVPSGHRITYWASAKFWSISGKSADIGSHGDSCDSDALHYSISCPNAFCMKRFQGCSDVPSGHAISYVAALGIQCGLCTDMLHGWANKPMFI